MTVQSALQGAVSRNLALHGTQVTLTRPAATDGATYDFATGGLTGGDSTPAWTGTAYFAAYRNEDIDGTTIRVGDRKMILRAQGLTRDPQINDVVDGELKVLDVRRVRSASTVLIFVCQVRS